jgi:hypothetical protein
MRSRRLLFALCGVMTVLCGLMPAGAVTLVSQAEADLPASHEPPFNPRGVTRGPGIELLSPSDTAAKSPMIFHVTFHAHNGALIDPASVTVLYLKAKPVDLTERIRPYVTADGIDIKDAEVPPGTHLFRIFARDSEGRGGTQTIKLSVTR